MGGLTAAFAHGAETGKGYSAHPRFKHTCLCKVLLAQASKLLILKGFPNSRQNLASENCHRIWASRPVRLLQPLLDHCCPKGLHVIVHGQGALKTRWPGTSRAQTKPTG